MLADACHWDANKESRAGERGSPLWGCRFGLQILGLDQSYERPPGPLSADDSGAEDIERMRETTRELVGLVARRISGMMGDKSCTFRGGHTAKFGELVLLEIRFCDSFLEPVLGFREPSLHHAQATVSGS